MQSSFCCSSQRFFKSQLDVRLLRWHWSVIAGAFASTSWEKAFIFTHIFLLCWESTDAHPGGVGLDDAIHSANVWRRHAKTSAHSAHSAVRRRHERIRAWTEKRQLTKEGDSSDMYLELTPHIQRCSPKSISSRAALAPSTRIFLLGPLRDWCMKYTPSVTRGRSLSAKP